MVSNLFCSYILFLDHSISWIWKCLVEADFSGSGCNTKLQNISAHELLHCPSKEATLYWIQQYLWAIQYIYIWTKSKFAVHSFPFASKYTTECIIHSVPSSVKLTREGTLFFGTPHRFIRSSFYIWQITPYSRAFTTSHMFIFCFKTLIL